MGNAFPDHVSEKEDDLFWEQISEFEKEDRIPCSVESA